MQNSIGAPKQRLSLSDPKVRAWLFQIITIVAVVSMGWYLFDNTQTNLQHRGITSGFDFLERSAGFGIAQHLIDYTESDSYARVFVIGLLNTLLVTFIGVILATILGFIVGVSRLSKNWIISQAGDCLCGSLPQHSAAAANPVLVLRGVPDHAGAAQQP